jgi:hypothetical protein
MSRIRAALALLAFAMLSGDALRAEPLRIEGQLGKCKYGITEIGGWWNDMYPTDIDPRDQCFQIGLSRIERSYSWANVGWRVAYVNLGTLRAQNTFAGLDEQQFTRFDRSKCNRRTWRNCVFDAEFSDEAKGFTLGAIAERNFSGVTLGADVGLFIYEGTAEIHLRHQGKPLRPINISGVTATPYLGITASYGYLLASFRAYASVTSHKHGCGGCNGLAQGTALSGLIGFQIPLGQ